mmetsp:Transcript_1678/g.5973  ORF Transcript_1678/g.5973 Transcript_1678/m.5973 type:complete len:351 (+) Transcript_1678:132-1184(+)
MVAKHDVTPSQGSQHSENVGDLGSVLAEDVQLNLTELHCLDVSYHEAGHRLQQVPEAVHVPVLLEWLPPALDEPSDEVLGIMVASDDGGEVVPECPCARVEVPGPGRLGGELGQHALRLGHDALAQPRLMRLRVCAHRNAGAVAHDGHVVEVEGRHVQHVARLQHHLVRRHALHVLPIGETVSRVEVDLAHAVAGVDGGVQVQTLCLVGRDDDPPLLAHHLRVEVVNHVIVRRRRHLGSAHPYVGFEGRAPGELCVGQRADVLPHSRREVVDLGHDIEQALAGVLPEPMHRNLGLEPGLTLPSDEGNVTGVLCHCGGCGSPHSVSHSEGVYAMSAEGLCLCVGAVKANLR